MRRGPARRAALLALLLLPVGLGVDRPPGLGDVVDVRHWSYPEYTRVVVEFDRPVEITLCHRRSLQQQIRNGATVERLIIPRRYSQQTIVMHDGLLCLTTIDRRIRLAGQLANVANAKGLRRQQQNTKRRD